jgi:hypothetical protein
MKEWMTSHEWTDCEEPHSAVELVLTPPFWAISVKQRARIDKGF